MADPGDEFIWGSDFNDRNLAALLHARFSVGRYRDLAALTEPVLRTAGLDDHMIIVVNRELAKRGLTLAGRHLRVVEV